MMYVQGLRIRELRNRLWIWIEDIIVQRKYTILRDVRGTPTTEAFDIGTRGAGPMIRSRTVPAPRVDTEELDKKDLRDLARDPEVAGVAPVMPTKLIAPLDVQSAGAATPAWGISAVGADVSSFNGSDVIVAVLDTGIDSSHEAFQGVALVEQDFSGSGNGDRNGHGTHCAGTIFGRDVDGTRIGVARGVDRALVGKVLSDDGSGDSDMIFRAIQWAVNSDANVISMSLGFDFPGLVANLIDQEFPAELATSIALEGYRGNLRMFDKIMEMVQARAAFGIEVVVVAAAGNESQRHIHPNFEIAAGLPAAAEGVISVGALSQTSNGLEVATFSNTLPQISAPGVNIVSARAGGGLVALNGTSMACPHVAGVTALWWQAVRQSPVPLSANSVLAKLFATARTNGFTANVDIADRGLGIVMAP